MSAENKSMVHRMLKAIDTQDMDLLDELFVPDIARLTKRSFTAFRSAFPDWRMELVELVAEGDTVVGRFRCSGTNTGAFKGAAPTGRRMEVDEVYFLTVRDGKFTRFWALEDDLSRMRQLGLLPSEG